MLESVGGPGPAALPLGAGSSRAWLGDRVFARLTVAGLGTRPRIESSIGSASIAQSLELAELAFAPGPGARFRPTFSLGVGAAPYSDTNIGRYAGREDSHWTAAPDAGVGLLASSMRASPCAFEVHALVALPAPEAALYDIQSATVVAVLASFTIIAWL